MVEFLVEKSTENTLQASLHAFGVVPDVFVWNEPKGLTAPDDRVAEREHPTADAKVKRGLLGAEHADRKCGHAPGEQCAVLERLDLLPLLELVQAVLVAPDLAAKPLLEPVAVAVVVPIREVDVLGEGVTLEPVGTLGGNEGIDQACRLGPLDVVGMDFAVDSLMESRPVVQAGQNLIHRSSSLSPRVMVKN